MNDSTDTSQQKKDEKTSFIFLTVFLAPILAVMIVGGFGFTIWISQIIMGPPGS